LGVEAFKRGVEADDDKGIDEGVGADAYGGVGVGVGSTVGAMDGAVTLDMRARRGGGGWPSLGTGAFKIIAGEFGLTLEEGSCKDARLGLERTFWGGGADGTVALAGVSKSISASISSSTISSEIYLSLSKIAENGALGAVIGDTIVSADSAAGELERDDAMDTCLDEAIELWSPRA
jgi:hypothetical protein